MSLGKAFEKQVKIIEQQGETIEEQEEALSLRNNQ